jgi:flagellar biosynthetic protein FliR
VTSASSDVILAALVLLCRIGACLMLMPGFSSRRVPVNVRLFLAIAVSLALMPILVDRIEPHLSAAAPATLFLLLASEVAIGALIGLLGRSYLAALETLGNVIALAIGLSSPLGGPTDDHEPQPSITSLVTLAATVLFFVAELHWEVLRGLAASYAALPAVGRFDAQFGLVEITDCLAAAFTLSLRISSPFIAYALIVNLAVGLASRLIPQIPIYFVTVPAVLFGGLALLYATCTPFLELFITGFSAWLSTG